MELQLSQQSLVLAPWHQQLLVPLKERILAL
jgi:hypothetical protein